MNSNEIEKNRKLPTIGGTQRGRDIQPLKDQSESDYRKKLGEGERERERERVQVL